MTAYTLGGRSFAEIALCYTVSKINAFFHFTQKFMMAAKNDDKKMFGKSWQITLNILGVKNLIKIAISRSVSDILKIFIFIVKKNCGV